MKKILIVFCILFLLPLGAHARTIKVMSLGTFSTENPSHTFRLQTVENEKFGSGYTLPAGTIISGTVNRVETPKRGKRDGYFELVPTNMEFSDEEINFDLSAYTARVIGYKPAAKIAYYIARVPANFFLKGAFYAISFLQGATQAQDGERLQSGFEQIYNDSFLSLVGNGKPLTIEMGDILILKLIKTR